MSWRRQPADAATIARQQAELDSAEASSADAETIARVQEGERKTETPSAQKLYNDYIMTNGVLRVPLPGSGPESFRCVNR